MEDNRNENIFLFTSTTSRTYRKWSSKDRWNILWADYNEYSHEPDQKVSFIIRGSWWLLKWAARTSMIIRLLFMPRP